MKNEVVQAEIAMHEGDAAIVRGDVPGEPVDQVFHRPYPFQFRRPVLGAPPVVLPPEVVAGTAKVRQPHGARIDPVQVRKDADHRVVNPAPFRPVQFRQGSGPEDTAVAIFHDVKHRADDVTVLAKMQHVRNGYVSAGQRRHYPVFPVHGVRGFEQFAGRLAP